MLDVRLMKAMDLVVGSVRETSSICLRGDAVVGSATQPLRADRDRDRVALF